MRYPAIDVHTSAIVSAIITALVLQAITLATREFLYVPIRSSRLIRRSMKNNTNGISTPFATCETMMTLISGNRGMRTNPAPTTTSDVYNQ